MTTVRGKQVVLRPLGRWTDWAKVLLGSIAVTMPEVLGGGRPVIGFEDTAGLVLAASGLWAIVRPRTRAAQWLALGASAALMLWPASVDPDELAAPWVGIVAGFLGAVLAIMRLREIPAKKRARKALAK